MQKYHLDQEQIKRQAARPLTVDESGVRRKDFLEPLQEEPEGMEDMDEGMYNRLDSSPQMDTRSYRADSIRAGSQPNVLLMNSFQKELIEETLGVRCHEVVIIHEVIKKIRNSI